MIDQDSIFNMGGENNFLDKFNGWEDSPEGLVDASDCTGLELVKHAEDETLLGHCPMTRGDVEATGDRGLYRILGDPALEVLTTGVEEKFDVF